MKILVIEDNHRIASHIKSQFIKNYIVVVAHSGIEGIAKASNSQFDAIILDLGLPDISGLDVCRQLRLRGIDSPILVLTGIDDMSVRVELLNCGADDYVTKPFNVTELSARVKAISRRKDRPQCDEVTTVQGLTINRTSRQVARGGVRIPLRRKEYEVLEYLINNRGRPLSREMILNYAWSSDREAWNNTVDVHVKHVRDKIDRPFGTTTIKTAYGFGYMVDDDS